MEEVEQPKKKKKVLKYVLYVSFVLIATAVALILSLWGKFDQTINALKQCDWRWLLLMLLVMLGFLGVDALILWTFCRIYTKKYRYTSACATILIGVFYSGITPGASGGQPMEAYTMKKQGFEVSNAASILVMWFILYQIALVLYGIAGFIFKFPLLKSMGDLAFDIFGLSVKIPIVPLCIIGFFVNAFVIVMLLAMSYSRKLHNWILNHGINIGAKLRLIKNPDKSRQNLRIKVENFKIELKRLQSNIPLAIVLICMFFLHFLLKFSLPWFAGAALNGYGDTYRIVSGCWVKVGHTVGDYSFVSVIDATFLSSFHQMVTGLLPLPGSAGVSELFFSMIFNGFFSKAEYMAAAQIIWRTVSFHIPLLIGGFTAAFYRCSPKEQFEDVKSDEFVTMQFQTYEERKQSADTLFETSKLSTQEIMRKLTQRKFFGDSSKKNDEINLETSEQNEEIIPNKNKKSFKERSKERKKERNEKRLEKMVDKEKKNKNKSWGDLDI